MPRPDPDAPDPDAPDISVRAGRVDLMFRNNIGALFHFEEQRNPRKADLYRSAAYHFHAAHQYGPKITDIILASGDVRTGDGKIRTESGNYSPTIVDLSKRNGRERLAEIREAVRNEEFENWLELVFLPLYGKETGDERSEMVEQVLRFESELYKAKKTAGDIIGRRAGHVKQVCRQRTSEGALGGNKNA